MKYEQLAQHYVGQKASGYDSERAKLEKWAAEQRIVEDLLRTLPSGASVIDVPVGTGRFIEAYHRLHLAATGIDISPDMMSIAASKARKAGLNMPLLIADIRQIAAPDGAFDAAVCICFLNWVDIRGARQAFRELTRVTRRFLIVSIRHYRPVSKLHLATQKGFWQGVLQIGARLYKTLDRGGLHVHKKADIDSMFHENGLEIKKRVRVVPTKYGTDYFIYLLEKSR